MTAHLDPTRHSNPDDYHDVIALLAYDAWEKNGRPPARDLEFWFEAEEQLKATRDLLVRGSTREAGGSETKTRGTKRARKR